jgi:hypothetical protein
LPIVHKQHCLELDDPVERLRFLRPLFEITTEPPDGDETDEADESDDLDQPEDSDDPDDPDDSDDSDDS